MTIQELQAWARKTLEFGIRTLRETGEVAQQFHLIYRDHVDVVVLSGSITNSEPGKRNFADLLRERIGGRDIEAVIMLSDTFTTSDMTPEADKIRRTFGMTIEQAAKAGMCTTREALVVSLESPIYSEVIRQEYRRKDGSREIEWVSEIVDAGRPRGGRFMNLFAPVAGKAQ